MYRADYENQHQRIGNGKSKRTSMDFNAISVNLTIFEADNRLAWTTSFNIDSKSCNCMRKICDQIQRLTHVKGSHGHHPHEVYWGTCRAGVASQ